MTENKNLNFDSEALNYFGKAYLKTPRVILEKLFSTNKNERMIAQMHWLLFNLCNYTDGYVTFNGQVMFCKKGEYITTCESLAQKLKVSRRTVKRYLETLNKNSLIEIRGRSDHFNLRVCGYEAFTASEVVSAGKRVSAVPEKQPELSDSEALARRRAEEEEKIGGGNKPRLDLLNQLYH